ncbi:MAG TPA: 16S rRNA (guanine(966)-N(2))-methyltransferase RsmD [Kofleriaceae bacterium]|nr:16S rRNA (guanine(966)-N(2))-methyltransferase RsmD [Kofleriaceae bacterium]
MRIVAGQFGGRVLRAPPGADTRPTSEKVREALFAILPDVAGAHVLDLFAGSGALGLEALSRGAAHATFVDSGKAALAAIRANLAALGVADRATVIAGDAVAVAARLAAAPRSSASPGWSLVTIDPPYASDLAERAASALARAQLAPGAVIVIEHDRRHAPPDAIGSLLRTDQRRYGDTFISFYGVSP